VQAPQQVRADGVKQMDVAQVEVVDERERRIRALDLGDRDGAIARHDRARHEREQLVIERDDLVPVGIGRGGRVAVDGVDRRLDLVRPGGVAPQAAANDRLALGDQIVIPGPAVLVGQQHELAAATRAGLPS
jgi:hypothetical protein